MNTKDNYLQLLKDPRWQKKKAEIMARDKYTCQCCGCKEKTLNVHHLKYLPHHRPWEYDNEDLITLCEDCHQMEHEELNKKLMKDVKLGKIYEYWHSDFMNTMICYDIDYLNQKVFLYGVDFGGGWGSAYDEAFSYKKFKECCTENDEIFDDIENQESSLMEAIDNLIHNKFTFNNCYVERDIHEIKRMFNKNLNEMFINNPKFKKSTRFN